MRRLLCEDVVDCSKRKGQQRQELWDRNELGLLEADLNKLWYRRYKQGH